MIASVEPITDPTVVVASSAKMVWDLLHTNHTNKSHTPIFFLRDQMQNIKSLKKVATYLQEIRSIVDALNVAGSPVANDEREVKILRCPR